MARRRIIDEAITSIQQAWGGTDAQGEWGYAFERVEAFIKAQLTSKVGALRWIVGDSTLGEDSSFYYLDGFAAEADIATYDSDPETYASLRLFHKRLPISTISSDSYIAQLTSDVNTTPNYAVKNGSDFEIHLRYQSIYVIGATSQSQNYSAYGTLTIERSVNNGATWTQVDKISGLASSDPTETAFPISLNLGKYLTDDRTNRFRLRASFQYTDEGIQQTRYSTYVTYSIQAVNLRVSMETDWAAPITANASTSQIALNFMVFGAIQKTLHICLDGDAEHALEYETRDYDASYNGVATGNINIDNSTRLFFTHGVHEVQTWLTCSDGVGGTITSDVVIYHLMIVNPTTPDADLTQPYFLLQELSPSVPNFVQSKICAYAIYNCDSTDPMSIALVIGASAGSIITVPQEEYYRSEVMAVQGTQYELDATLEIEAETDYPDAYLHVTRDDDGTIVDFLYETTGAAYQVIPVDNTAGYAPTAGSTFYLNPKLRNNSEDNPARILNAKAQNAEVTSTWTGFKFDGQDGWVLDDDGNKVLRVPAGCLLNIALNPFAQFLTQAAGSLTIFIRARIFNVTNEEDPILKLCEAVGQNFIGLRMRPMIGTITSSSHTSEDTSDFRWQEDVVTDFAINICNAVSPNSARDGLTSDGSIPTGTIPLVRVFVNGVIVREYQFDNTSNTEFCTAALSNGGMFIGQEGADIDIHGIRIWASQQLSSQQCYQNHVSSLPSATDKIYAKTQNDIMAEGRVSIDKVKAIGKNVLIWHGQEVWHGASSDQRGWWEFYQYDANGQVIPELSGTICKESASLKSKGQGTTAKTYYYWNLQTKYSDVTATINVPLTSLHSSITKGDIFTDGDDRFIPLKGGCLGKNFPLSTESTQNYPVVVVDGVDCVVVPDGWIDGNDKYRGPCHHVDTALPLAQKDVLKINYASSMQSHIIGVNKLYNRLHTAYVGPNALQGATSGAVVAKCLEPFLFFTQASDNADPVYRGPGAWGAGKMDKPTWGYVKSAFPNFCMIEGADNNKELTDMRVPFDDTVHGNDTYPKVFYNPEEEAFYYRTQSDLSNAQKSIDFDGGKTVDIAETDSTHLFVGEYPHPDIVNYIRSFYNFLFLHNPRIMPYIKSGGSLGTFSEFTSSSEATNTGMKYWCSDYKLYRYDFADGAWVPAGLWNGSAYAEVNLKDSTAESGTLEYNTYTQWNALSTNEKADYSGAVNNAFIAGIVAHAKANLSNYVVVNSLKFHYTYENHFIAGTDNCSKNTYQVLVPTSGSMGSWSDWRFEFHQDDVDTTVATDNSGLQTKPYYIDRMHPYEVIGYVWKNGSTLRFTKSPTLKAGDYAYNNPDLDYTHAVLISAATENTITIDGTTYTYDTLLYSNDSLYEGGNNVLFNLCEEMWENTLELADAMRSVLTLMAGIASSIPGSSVSQNMTGCWGTLNKYIFDVQRYIPAMAFNEAARIRYEFPKLMGYTSDQRQVDPITQSMGDQLEAELQWMKRRLVYMASYAEFGEFMPGSTANTGLSDLAQSFAMVMAALPNSTTQTSQYKFRLVPHQWMYPTAALAQSGINPHVRVAPGAYNMPNGYYELIISPTARSDDGVTVYGINYYRSIGNIGDNCFDPTTALTLNGKRLTAFIAEPTTYYSTTIGGGSITAEAWQALTPEEKVDYLPAFRCSGVQIGSATRLSKLSMKGCSSVGGGSVNFSALSRAAVLDFRSTNFLSIVIPQTSTLVSLQLPASLTSLSLTAQPSLEELSFEGVSTLTQLTITDSPLVTGDIAMLIIESMRVAETPATFINLAGVSWTGVMVRLMRYLISVGTTGVCKLTGSIELPTGQIMSYDEVATLMERYGNIRSESNPLYISYPIQTIGSTNIGVGGRKYLIPSWMDPLPSYWQHWMKGVYHEDAGFWLTVDYGNNVLAASHVVNGETVWTPDVTWALVGDGDTVYAEFPDQYSPLLWVKSVYPGRTIKIRVTVRTTTATLTYDKVVGLWNRIPEVGDFAWSDGTFDKEDDTSKKFVGVVIMREPLEVDSETGDITKARLWVQGLGEATPPSSTYGGTGGSSDIPSSGGQAMTRPWGMYHNNSNLGFSDTKSSNVYVDDIMAMIQSYLVNTVGGFTLSSDLFDTPLPNLSENFTIRPSTYQNSNNNNPVNGIVDNADGTARITAQPVGDGDGYYQRGAGDAVSDFATIYNNKTMMEYANNILAALVTGLSIDVASLPPDVDPQTYVPKTRQAYADLTLLIQRYVAARIQSTEGNPVSPAEADLTWTDANGKSLAVIRQLMFPAFRLCSVWSPSDIAGNGITEYMLNEQYKKGRWMLPSNGLLARIFNFLYNSSCNSDKTRTASAEVKRGNANEDVAHEAQLPLYSNVLERSDGRCTVPLSAGSNHWSSNEYGRSSGWNVSFSNGNTNTSYKYNQAIVRPVVAFIFEA